MNILMLGHQYRNYGTYWRIWFLARGLVKLGHQVTLATVSPRSKWHPRITEEDGVTIWEGPDFLHDLPGQGTGPLDIAGRKKLIRLNRYDVIHGFEFYPNVRFPMQMGLRQRKPIVISDWCDWYSQAGLGPKWGKVPGIKAFIARQEDKLRTQVHGVTVISHLLEERSKQLAKDPDNVLYLPGGAPVDVIHSEDKTASRSRWGIDRGKKVVGFVGTNQEDLDILVEAFIKLALRDSRCLLYLIGPDNAKANSLLKKYGLQDRIKVVGKFQYEDLSTMMGCCDVFALPLRATVGNAARWPNKIGEYLSAARPVVASNVGEMKWFFKDHQVGTTCSNAPEAFAEALTIYLENDALARRTGEEAREIAEKVLAWDTLSGRLESFYEKIMETHQ